jgi:hypothetical protein
MEKFMNEIYVHENLSFIEDDNIFEAEKVIRVSNSMEVDLLNIDEMKK